MLLRVSPFVLAASLTMPAAAQLVYKTPTDIATGPDASAILASDLDGDGDLDLIIANRGGSAAADDGTVITLWNDGAGVFGSLRTLDTGNIVRPIALGLEDFDGDGNDDLAILLLGSDALLVLKGDGTGAFTGGALSTTGDGPEFMAIGDFDGAGGPDIVTSNESARSLTVLLNNGDLTFGASDVELDITGGFGPQGVAAADFDGNSTDDVAVALPASDEVAILRGTGDGNFAESFETFAVGADPGAVVAADVNKDNAPDLVVANTVGDSVTVLLNDGGGGFTAGDFATGNDPRAIVVIDVDGDGNLDIVTANFESDNVSILTGKGDGTFNPAQSFNVANGPFGLAVGDFDKSLELDIATANQESDDASVLLAGVDTGSDPVTMPGCAAGGCGPLGLTPFALMFAGIGAMKRRRFVR